MFNKMFLRSKRLLGILEKLTLGLVLICRK